MGVKDLWNVLSPLGERKPLYELQGKTVAIDLSGWVVDCQTIDSNAHSKKLYLRNLFFRTSKLLNNNVFPIFVLEGTAPSLKHKTIAKRNEVRNGSEEKGTGRKGGRSQFNHVLKECEEMLKYMGLVCVKGYGEAEAMCAYLNADGLVDGCISQDSDCFLYGAKVVYRNFCVSTQGSRATSSGSIDEYNINKIQEVLNIDRKKMIAMALLCGCDYDEGLNGVGKEAVLKLFKIVGENDILTRMKAWKTMESKFIRLKNELSNPNICKNCGHPGKTQSHTKIGCSDCGTAIKCGDSSYKEKRDLIKNELAIRDKALSVENFPKQELIDEFLLHRGPIPKLNSKWAKPRIVEFVKFMKKKVLWEPTYAFAKIFPLMTRWQLTNLIEYPIEQRLSIKDVLVPGKIKNIRTVLSVPSYEILWLDKDDILQGLTMVSSDSGKENYGSPDALPELVSIEEQDLFSDCYPSIVEDFKALRNAKKKKPVTKCIRKKKTDAEDVENNGGEPAKKPERKKRGKTSEVANNRKILDFVTIDKNHDKMPSSALLAPIRSLENSFESMSLTPNVTPKRRKRSDDRMLDCYTNAKKRGPQFDKVMTVERMDSVLDNTLEMLFNKLTPDDFKSDNEEDMNTSDIIDGMNMSDIIDGICNTSDDAKPEHENRDIVSVKTANRRDKKALRSIENSMGVKLVEHENLDIASVKTMNRRAKKPLRSIENSLEVESVEHENLDIASVKRGNRSIEKLRKSLNNSADVQLIPIVDISKDDDDVDEFDMLDKTYVPLDERLNDRSDDEEDRFSMGIESLLNDTFDD